ncbi:mechanosensitive ion channel domain-containing protein [Rapidithrix thailandica]|uniref:Mechanosensitive ion channel domain-containing protein n=1 Tax=Rapidithrix thailandica TaxID=413964 RepID=A0AAW9SEF8_9BACT
MTSKKLSAKEKQFQRKAFLDRIKLGAKILSVTLLYLGQRFLPELYKGNEYVTRLVDALLFYLTAWLVVSVVEIILVEVYSKGRKIRAGKKDNFILGISWIASILSFIFLVMAVFMFFKIDVKGLFTSLSIIAAAIAIISKDYISNMINGMLIMFADRISLNDYVKIEEHKGKIIDITLMHVHLMDDEDDLVYIPNNTVFSGEVINYTKRQINRINFEFQMAYKHMESVEVLEEYLNEALYPYKELIVHDSQNLRTVEIKSDLAILNYQYIIKKSNKEIETEIRKVIARKVIQYVSDKEKVGQ